MPLKDATMAFLIALYPSSFNSPILLISCDWLIVTICSIRQVLVFLSPHSMPRSVCTGKKFFSWLVRGTTMVVGLYLLPTSFCRTITGLFPHWMLPSLSPKSAIQISPCRILLIFLILQ